MQVGQIELRRILIVEDEMILALNLEDMLMELGHTVVAIATRIRDAIDLAKSCDIDLAILDLNLSGSLSFPVAEILRQRGIPFMFASGYGENGLVEGFQNEFVLTKPYLPRDLQNAMRDVGLVSRH
jgi:CheY-like chemotaxis protein